LLAGPPPGNQTFGGLVARVLAQTPPWIKRRSVA